MAFKCIPCAAVLAYIPRETPAVLDQALPSHAPFPSEQTNRAEVGQACRHRGEVASSAEVGCAPHMGASRERRKKMRGSPAAEKDTAAEDLPLPSAAGSPTSREGHYPRSGSLPQRRGHPTMDACLRGNRESGCGGGGGGAPHLGVLSRNGFKTIAEHLPTVTSEPRFQCAWQFLRSFSSSSSSENAASEWSNRNLFLPILASRGKRQYAAEQEKSCSKSSVSFVMNRTATMYLSTSDDVT